MMDDSSIPSRPATTRRQLITGGAAAVCATFLPSVSRADKWPSKPIRFVCAQAPGASTDGTARSFADYFSTHLGVPVTVENKPGGAGMIAAETVARSAPDGYTFLVTLHSQLAQAPVMLKKPPINPDTDLTPIGKISTGRGIMVGRKDLPGKSFLDIVESAKTKPISVGNYSIGSGWHLLMSEVGRQTGAKFDIVNYRGTGLMLPDLVGGSIDIGAGSFAGFAKVIEAGAVRPILIISEGKTPRYPDLLTWDDLGFKGEVFTDLSECNMLLGPAKLPQPIVERLSTLYVEAVDKSARVKALRHLLIADDKPLVGKELRDYIGRSWPLYRKMSRELGLSGTL